MEQCVFNKWEASNRCELCIIQRSLSLREREHGVRNTGWDQYVCLCDNITSPEKVRRDKRNREELKERRTPAGGASRESKKERIRQHEDQTAQGSDVNKLQQHELDQKPGNKERQMFLVTAHRLFMSMAPAFFWLAAPHKQRVWGTGGWGLSTPALHTVWDDHTENVPVHTPTSLCESLFYMHIRQSAV